MTIAVATALATTLATAIATAIDAGTAAGNLKLYDGTRPATGGAVTTLVSSHALSYPCQASIASGVLAFAAIGDGLVVAAGPVTWGRIATSADAFVLDLSVSDFSAVYATYSVASFNALLAHFSVSTPAALLAALTANDRALLGDIVLSTVSPNMSEYVRLALNISVT